jgi:hypothetical protein
VFPAPIMEGVEGREHPISQSESGYNTLRFTYESGDDSRSDPVRWYGAVLHTPTQSPAALSLAVVDTTFSPSLTDPECSGATI